MEQTELNIRKRKQKEPQIERFVCTHAPFEKSQKSFQDHFTKYSSYVLPKHRTQNLPGIQVKSDITLRMFDGTLRISTSLENFPCLIKMFWASFKTHQIFCLSSNPRLMWNFSLGKILVITLKFRPLVLPIVD